MNHPYGKFSSDGKSYLINTPETPRPSVGLRHYIPLFFLAPSMLLLVHAWNRTAPPEPR